MSSDRRPTDLPTPGKVFLVGAGPGDPELLTLRGRRRLAAADVVLHDYLASEELLRHARPSAQRVCFGKAGKGKTWKQADINERIVAEALAGKTVVRLKGGDPTIFGRLAEEIAACRGAGIDFEIVPGVTTALAAGAYAGVTLTDRDKASCVTFVTGHEQPGKDADQSLDFAALAATPGTLVIYMAAANAARWSKQLIAAGKPGETPVLLVRRVSLPDQSTHRYKLMDLTTLDKEAQPRPPLIAIVGEVADETTLAAWFTQRPLFGKTVVVTRPREQAQAMADRLRDLGARVLLQPTIEIGPPADQSLVDDAIDRLPGFDLVVFSSRNGVDRFLGSLKDRGGDARRFGSCRIAAIGPATAQELADWRLTADVLPGEYRAEALVEELRSEAAGKRILLVRASRGREVLAEQLASAGATVEQVVAYQSTDVAEASAEVVDAVRAGQVDWITATSSAIARATARLLGDAMAEAAANGQKAALAAISPLTAEALRQCGYEAGVVASIYTADGVVEAILRAEATGEG